VRDPASCRAPRRLRQSAGALWRWAVPVGLVAEVLRIDLVEDTLWHEALEALLVHSQLIRLGWHPDHGQLLGKIVLVGVQRLDFPGDGGVGVGRCDQLVGLGAAVVPGVGAGSGFEELLAGREVVRGVNPATAPVAQVPTAAGRSGAAATSEGCCDNT
jgi:hypothetical protein